MTIPSQCRRHLRLPHCEHGAQRKSTEFERRIAQVLQYWTLINLHVCPATQGWVLPRWDLILYVYPCFLLLFCVKGQLTFRWGYRGIFDGPSFRSWDAIDDVIFPASCRYYFVLIKHSFYQTDTKNTQNYKTAILLPIPSLCP